MPQLRCGYGVNAVTLRYFNAFGARQDQTWQPSNIPHLHASLKRTRAELGYEPQIGPPEGLDRAIALCCRQLAAAAPAA